ncbi:MAG: molecular chaperone DnaK, partial [Sediminibacterium sp.]
FQTEKQFKEFGDKIPADKKGAIETALNKLKEAHKNQEIAAVDAAMAEMNTAWTAASEDIYKAQQAAGGDAQPGADNTGANASQAGGETVTDAEFEEVK